GRGRSLFERAAVAPGCRLFGIEVRPKWAYRVDARCRTLGLRHVRVWCGNALDLIARFDSDTRLERAFVHFPDPWWEKRHAGRRLVGPRLLDGLARTLATRGELFVQTDVEERAHAYVAALRAHSDFSFGPQGPFVPSNHYGARSNREVRAEAD